MKKEQGLNIKCWKYPERNTLDEHRPVYGHFIQKFDRNGFCPARFECHGNFSPFEILPKYLAQENMEMNP